MQALARSTFAGSILIGQKERRDRAIPLRDDPVLHALGRVVDREDPIAPLDRLIVHRPVLLAAVAPIALQIAIEERCDGLPALGQSLTGSLRRIDGAER